VWDLRAGLLAALRAGAWAAGGVLMAAMASVTIPESIVLAARVVATRHVTD
jgi:hypothetical protein